MTIRKLTGAAVVAAAALLAAAALAAQAGTAASGQITVGASIPLSGPLAGFGSFQKWGYTKAVSEANAKGGILVDGKKLKVKLILLDDKTDSNVTSSNTDRLITKDKVDGLLGSCTPALVNAGAVVADRAKVPLVTGCDPLEAFKSVKKWQYVWDLFFWEPDLAAAPFRTMKARGVKTNKKVAILARQRARRHGRRRQAVAGVRQAVRLHGRVQGLLPGRRDAVRQPDRERQGQGCRRPAGRCGDAAGRVADEADWRPRTTTRRCS